MKITDLLTKDRINLNILSTNKDDVLKEIASLHQNTGVLNDFDGFINALKEREALSSTGLEEGIAIPHAKTNFVNFPALAFARSNQGVDYDSLDGNPSTLFFMIAAPNGHNNEHIETLAKLTQLLLDDDFKKLLENAQTAEEVLEIISKKENEEEKEVESKNEDLAYIIAATACPTGIAHTYMAAEALKKAANELGVKIKVETNGADGIKDKLTEEDIKNAKGVILAINRNIETARFDGKPLIQVEAKEAINKAKELIQKILDNKASKYVASNNDVVSEEKNNKSGLYKHLLSGVSYMLPLVISGGILIALAFLADTLTGNGNVGGAYGSTSDLAKILMEIGGKAFSLFVPILGGYIAYSISERAALSAGLVAGALASSGNSGFLGAMLGGFVAGYVVKFLIKALNNLPKSLNGLKMILLYPVLSVLITGLTMILVLNPIVSKIYTLMNNGLNSLSGGSALLLGAILAGMMAVDMGGPINKAAYVFGTGTLTAEVLANGGSSAMAAVMAGGMVPPLAIAIATTLFKNKFNKEEQEAGISNYVMGLSFITEGAIPYAAADPTKILPASIIGAALSGALTMLFTIKIPAPHGGILVMGLSKTANGSNGFILYLIAILIGSFVSALILAFLKKKNN